MPSNATFYLVGDKIALSIPRLCGNELRYLEECIQSGWVSSSGPFVERFERQIANFVNTKFAVATSSGTAALHLALQVAGVQANDEVLVPSLTFIAPANAVRYVGAWPILMDSDPVYWQLDVDKVREFLQSECELRSDELRNRKTGRRIRAIIPVHMLGHPVDMDPLIELANRFGITVIEDATESLGSEYKGRRTGSLGHLGCFSFNGNKIITCGGGGMITTNDPSLANYARYLSTQAKDDALEYIHDEIGYNYRLTNVQAALGVAQMELISSFVVFKRSVTAKYNSDLANTQGISLPKEANWARSNCWLYTIQIDSKLYGEHSRDLLRRLRDASIESRPLWCPVHKQKPYRNSQTYKIEVAEHLYQAALSLPCSVGVTDSQLDRVIASVKRSDGAK